METQEILKFKSQIKDFTLEELEKQQKDIQNAISKMILDSDLIMKAAIVEAAIAEKKGK